MKKLNLDNASYRYLEKSFKDWLDVQGYAQSTVYNLPNHIREFLYYIEKEGVLQIKQLDTKHFKSYYQHLQERSNQRRGGGLSNGHLNKHIQALRKFTEYLRKVGRMELPEVPLHNESASQRLVYLTEEEVRELFNATRLSMDELPHQVPTQFINLWEALQSRDRAMLAVFYGCGLRRNEGVNLDVDDILFDKSLLHVRKGKNYQERLVPISRHSLLCLQEWVYDYRHSLLRYDKASLGTSSKGSGKNALFLNYRGTRLQGQSFLNRLKGLIEATDNPTLKEKEIGLHTLRHSIATHLLGHGMSLENISRFLCHSSLESTQIYVHILSDNEITSAQSFTHYRSHPWDGPNP